MSPPPPQVDGGQYSAGERRASSPIESRQQRRRRREEDEQIGGSGATTTPTPPLDCAALIDAGERRAARNNSQQATPSQHSPGARKLYGADADGAKQFDKTNYQSTDELNNNSIEPSKAPPTPSSPLPPLELSLRKTSTTSPTPRQQQQREASPTKFSPLPPPPSSSSPGKTLQVKLPAPTTTPLSLLTGLRMHTSNLRAQRASNAAAATATSSSPNSYHGAVEQPQMSEPSRKPSIPSAKSQEHEQQQHRPQQAARTYVESSLNPPETGSYALPNKRPSEPHIPSYTSAFNHQKATTSSPSPDQRPIGSAKQTTPTSVSSYTHQQQQHQLFTESHTATRTSRGPLVKQVAQHQPSDLSTRSLFSSASRHSDLNPNRARQLPSIFDQASGELKRPVDYDLDDLDDDDQEDDGEDEEEDEDSDDVRDDGIDYRERNIDDQSQSSAFSSTNIQRAGNLLDSLKQSQATAKRSLLNLSSPESHQNQRLTSTNKQQQQPVRLIKSTQSKPPANSATRRGRSPSARRADQLIGRTTLMSSTKKLAQPPTAPAQKSQGRISTVEMSRPPSFNTTTLQQQQHQQELEAKVASCRKLDLLEQAAHMDCSCHICCKNRKLASLHDDLYHHHHPHLGRSTSKLSQFNLNKSGLNGGADSLEKNNYPKTRFVHMVLKSIILVLCTLLLLLLVVGTLLISHYLPQSMDKVVNASRSFNVTIAGRR